MNVSSEKEMIQKKRHEISTSRIHCQCVTSRVGLLTSEGRYISSYVPP